MSKNMQRDRNSISRLISVLLVFSMVAVSVIFKSDVKTLAAAVEMIYSEDFDGDALTGTVSSGTPGTGSWRMSGNSLVSVVADTGGNKGIKIVNGGTTACVAWVKIPDQTETITMQFRVKMDSASGGVTFLYGSGDLGSAKNELFKIKLNGSSFQRHYLSGGNKYANFTEPAASYSTGIWRTVAIQATPHNGTTDAKKVKVFVDGVELKDASPSATGDLMAIGDNATLTATDVDFTKIQGFGVKSSSSDTGTIVWIDDVKIYKGAYVDSVEPVQPASVTLNNAPSTLKLYSIAELDPVVNYNDNVTTDKNVTYEVLKGSQYVNIMENNIIQGKSKGTATIRVASKADPTKYYDYNLEVTGDLASPSSKFNLDKWKITLPTLNSTQSGALEADVDEMVAGYQSEWFFLDESDNSMVFWSPVDGAKTATTSYTRSELREMIDKNNTAVNWGWKGTHIFETEEAVILTPSNGKTIVSQIHGVQKNGANANPLLKVYYLRDTKQLQIDLKQSTAVGAGDDKKYFNNIELGQKFRTKIEVIEGVLYVTVSTTDKDGTFRSETYTHKFMELDPLWEDLLGYFKVGNYVQDSVRDKPDGPLEGAIVKVYDICADTKKPGVGKINTTFHDNNYIINYPLNGVGISRDSAYLQVKDSLKLEAIFSPAQATDKNIKWSVESGSDKAAVSKEGIVTAIAEGTATVRVASVANPNLYADCVITVQNQSISPNDGQVIYFEDFGTTSPKNLSAETAVSWTFQSNKPTVELDGNNYVLKYVDTFSVDPGAVGAQVELKEPISLTNTTTVSFDVKITDVLTKNGTSSSNAYFSIGGGNVLGNANGNEFARIRSNATVTSGELSNYRYQPSTASSSYADPSTNADKAKFSLDEWKTLTFVITPDNGSAYGNKFDAYIDGYKVAEGIKTYVEKPRISHISIYSGTADQMTFMVDNIKVIEGNHPPQVNLDVEPSQIVLSKTPGTIAVGDSLDLKPSFLPQNAVQDAEYSVISGDAVIVGNSGVLTAVKVGSATVRIAHKYKPEIYTERTFEVVESMIGVTGMTINSHNTTIQKNGIFQIIPTITPANATEPSVIYELIRGGDYVTVSESGLVQGIKEGVAEIKVTSLNNPKLTQTCIIAVSMSNFTAPVSIYSQDFGTGTKAVLNEDKKITPYWVFTNPKQVAPSGTSLGSITKTDVVDDNGNFVLRVLDNALNDLPIAALIFQPQSGITTTQFRFKLTETALGGSSRDFPSSITIPLIGADGVEVFALKAIYDGTTTKLQYTNEDSSLNGIDDYVTNFYDFSTPITLNLNEWVNIRLVTVANNGSPRSNTTDVYINGNKVASGVTNNGSNLTVGELQIKGGRWDWIASAIDDLEIYSGEYFGAESISVYFDSQGGNAVNPITNVTSGSKITAPSNPTKSGYTFSGWYKEAGCINAWNFESDIVTENTTLYAKWTISETRAVTIIGTPKFKQTLTAETTDFSNTATLSYQWKRNGQNIGTNSRIYTVVSEDIGCTITCDVTSSDYAEAVSSNSVLIGKADAYPASNVDKYHLLTETGTKTVSGTFVVPVDAGVTSYYLGMVTGFTNIFDAQPSIDALTGVISYSLSGTCDSEQTVIVPVTISMANYNDIEFEVIVTVSNRMPITIEGLSTPNKIYDGTPIEDSDFGTPILNPSWSGILEYTYYEGHTTSASALILAPTNAGLYTLKAAIPYSDTSYIGSVELTFVIAQKNVDVIADSKSMLVGESVPELTVTYDGFVGNDILTMPLTTLAVAETSADGSLPGGYDITFDTRAVLDSEKGLNYTLTHINGILTVSVSGYTVTFHPNGGTGNMSVQKFESGVEQNLFPNAFYRTDYSFMGWNTEANGSGTAYTNMQSVTLTSNITLYAQWFYNPPYIPNVPEYDNTIPPASTQEPASQPTSQPTPVQTPTKTQEPTSVFDLKPTSKPTKLEIEINIGDKKQTTTVMVKDNTVSFTIPQKGVDNAIQHAKSETLAIDLRAPAEFKNVSVILTPESIAAFAKNFKQVELKTSFATLSFDKNALDVISNSSKTDVEISTSADGKIYEFTVASGKNNITQFGNGRVSISFPYELQTSQTNQNTIVYYINPDGERETVKSSMFEAGKIFFTTNHFSKYTVAHNNVTFKDVTSADWFENAVNFVASRELFSGTGDGRFSPADTMTRAMFLSALSRLDGVNLSNYRKNDGFWYSQCVAWAVEKGLIPNSSYNPNESITREEIAVILSNYIKSKDIILPILNLASFNDMDKVSPNAREAVEDMKKYGLVTGYNNLYNPSAPVDRAAAATIFMNIVKVMSK